MVLTVVHSTVATFADEPGAEINKAQWNANHSVAGTLDVASITGLGTLATQNGTFSGTSSGTNTGDQNLFGTISVSGQSDIVADSTNDTVTFVAGTGITITTDAAADSITINASSSGDVVGPTAATDNAIALYNTATGKLIKNSTTIIAAGAISPSVNDSGTLGTSSLGWSDTYMATGGFIDWGNNNVRITHAAASLTTTGADVLINRSSATAFVVGPNGLTNPTLTVVTNTASGDCGVTITNAAAGVTMNATGTDTNITMSISSKGNASCTIAGGSTGVVNISPGGNTRYQAAGAQHLFTNGTSTAATSVRFSYVSANDITLTAGTEAPSVYFNLTGTRQHASNTAVTLQRDYRISGTSHSFASATGTITNCATLALDSFGQAGSQAIITNAHGLYIPTQAVAGTVTNSYGITVAAPTGAGTKNLAINATGLSELGTVQATRINPRVTSTASSATPTPNADTDDEYILTALAAGATFAAPTGTPVQGQKLLIRIKDNATPRTLAWNAIYRAGDVPLPTTTVTSKTMYAGFIYNSTDTTWDLVSTIGNF